MDRAKAKIQNNPDHVLYEDDIKDIFKELQETEEERNERIRQAIIDCMKSYTSGYTLLTDDISVKEAIGWLEKQSEQAKTNEEQAQYEWTKEDETGFIDAIWCINKVAKIAKDENEMGNCWTAEKWIKSLNPKNLREGRRAESLYVTPHKEFFNFIYERLIHKYGENPNVDYMQSLKDRIDDLFE